MHTGFGERDVPVYFTKIMLNHMLHVLRQCGFIVKECEHWPAIENVWHIMKLKIRQPRPRAVEQLKQEWGYISPKKLQFFSPQFPNAY